MTSFGTWTTIARFTFSFCTPVFSAACAFPARRNPRLQIPPESRHYLTFANKCPKNHNALAIANELNALGYLYPQENELSVNDISMSKRLQNVLMRNNILYLSQLSIHPEAEMSLFFIMHLHNFQFVSIIIIYP